MPETTMKYAILLKDRKGDKCFIYKNKIAYSKNMFIKICKIPVYCRNGML